jgi:hypothetical protein
MSSMSTRRLSAYVGMVNAMTLMLVVVTGWALVATLGFILAGVSWCWFWAEKEEALADEGLRG